MTPESASKVSQLAEFLKSCAENLESEEWQELHDNAEEIVRLARWLQLDEEQEER